MGYSEIVQENLPNSAREHYSNPRLNGYAARLVSLPQRLPDEDRKIVTDFDRHLAANQLSAGHRANYLTRLTKIREMVGKSLREASKNDLEKVLADLGNRQLSSRTIQGYKITLKSFYKWLLGNNEEYPDNVRWIKTTLKNGRKLPRDSLLTNEEIEKLIQVCYTDRDRAMVLILAESGVRSGELLSLRVRDVRFDQYGAIINVTGKTGDRSVRLIASAPALATWFEHHPTRDNPTAPLWVDLKTNKLGEGMTYQGLRSVILRLKNRVGIKKHIHLHGFRHTAATRLARLLTEAEMKSYLGWVQGSQMASVYIHLSSKDVDRSLLRIHGLITEDEDKECKFTAIKCPRCTHANNPGTKLCEKCGLPLTFEAVKEIDAKLAFKRALLEKVMQMPEFEKIKDLIEALGEKVLAEAGA